MAKEANNHFGIKCGKYWDGETYKKEDDEYNDRGKKIKSCFRKYENPEESFIAHSEFLTDPNKSHRYGRLFEYEATDYYRWAHGLKKAGYATNPKYPYLLIDLIERFNLFKYDTEALLNEELVLDVEKPDPSHYYKIRKNNATKYVWARKGDTPYKVAAKFKIPIKRLMTYNEQLNSKVTPFTRDQRIYLQRKRKSYYGKRSQHYVRQGETLELICVRYGIRLDALRKLNKIPEGGQPLAGQGISLRGKVKPGKEPKYHMEGETVGEASQRYTGVSSKKRKDNSC